MNLDLKKNIDLYMGGALIILLRPLVMCLGFLLKRDHNPVPKGDIVIIKLLGGGSLVIGYSALLGIKSSYPNNKLKLITTNSIAPFAKSLNIFDEILILNDSNLFTLTHSSVRIILKLFKVDTIIDWEVYSRATTIFSLLTCARNRIGFYREDVKSRKYFNTHIIFFNLYYGSWYFYEELSRLIGAKIPSNEKSMATFKSQFKTPNNNNNRLNVGIGHACSDLSPERMLTPNQWRNFFQRNLDTSYSYNIYFWGTKNDSEKANRIIAEIKKLDLDIQYYNRCGKTKLNQSIDELVRMDEFWGIDSALLHYARLLGIKTVAFFGPTSPQSLLKPLPIPEKINYKQMPCSPCVHVTEKPPCKGKNICIQNLFSSN